MYNNERSRLSTRTAFNCRYKMSYVSRHINLLAVTLSIKKYSINMYTSNLCYCDKHIKTKGNAKGKKCSLTHNISQKKYKYISRKISQKQVPIYLKNSVNISQRIISQKQISKRVK